MPTQAATTVTNIASTTQTPTEFTPTELPTLPAQSTLQPPTKPTESIATEVPIGTINNPARSCSEISFDSPSGDYWIKTNSSTSPIQVYCDTNPRNCSCNATGGWTRVANIDMTDPTQ